MTIDARPIAAVASSNLIARRFMEPFDPPQVVSILP